MTKKQLGDIFELKCIPRYEVFFSEESMYGVYEIMTKEALPHSSVTYISDDIFSPTENDVRTERFVSTLVGNTQKLAIDQEYKITARLSNHPKHGFNYTIISVASSVPKTELEQKKFLMAILTERQADSLIGAYPNIVNEVMNENDNIDFSKVHGIAQHTWNKIKKKIVENYVLADILSLLSPLGITINKIQKLLEKETNPMVLKEKILNNPYILSDIPGVGFRSADKIAIGLKPELRVSVERLSAFIVDFLKGEGNDEGHTWVKIKELKNNVEDGVSECIDLFVDLLKEQKENSTFLYVEKNKVGIKFYRDIEMEIMDVISELNKSEPLHIPEKEILDGIAEAEKDQGFEFTKEQLELIKKATTSNFNIVTGKAGCGKSTLLRGIYNVYKNRYSVATCALSAKAAKRIEETTGQPSSTIHRLLGARGLTTFDYNKDHKMPHDIIILDEASMVNAGIMRHLLSAIKDNAKVIFCGDAKQLPPIGYGNVFSDLIEKENLQINYLTKILRQAEASGIITDANKIRNGISPLDEITFKITHGELGDMHYRFRESRESLNKIAIEAYLKSVEEVGIDNVFILTPRKNTVINSTLKINKIIQDKLLGDVPLVKHFSKEFKLGCKVIHRKNNYQKNIFNGEMGYVTSVLGDGLEVDYDGKKISYTKSELKELDHAYALTTHLYQGSEAHTIIGIIDSTHYLLLDTTHLYTMITRSSKRMLLLAEPQAFKRCLKNNKSINRNTWIKEMG